MPVDHEVLVSASNIAVWKGHEGGHRMVLKVPSNIFPVKVKPLIKFREALKGILLRIEICWPVEVVILHGDAQCT